MNKVLTNLSFGGSLDDVMLMNLNVAEEESPGTIASILFVDKDGKRLLTDIKTRLPKYFIEAIDGTPVKDGMGSCGIAAFRGETIIVENIQTHPYWKGVREITRKAGLGSCWSQPVIASNGNVVGTFALYSNKPKKPSQDELKLMGRMAQLAAISKNEFMKITDMAMPKMSGDELALKIIAMRKDIPIILCTGYTEKVNKEKAEEMGITRCIDKPIAGKALCLWIREVLDEYRKT